MTWLDEEACLRADLEEIERTGYAFDLAGTHVMPDRQERVRQWPQVKDWVPPAPRPPKVVRQPRPLQPDCQPQPDCIQAPVPVAPPPEMLVLCNATDVFACYSYTGCFEEAQRRMKAGAHQARCLACMLYRWADEPCDSARFAGGKGPRPERARS